MESVRDRIVNTEQVSNANNSRNMEQATNTAQYVNEKFVDRGIDNTQKQKMINTVSKYVKEKYFSNISSDMSELYQKKREIQNSDKTDDEKRHN